MNNLVEKEKFEDIIKNLIHLHDTIKVFLNNHSTPSPSSQVISEYQEYPYVEHTHAQVNLWIDMLIDTFLCFIRTFKEPILTISPWVVARTSLELSALCCWLYDPNIITRERIGRSLAFRYRGLIEQRKSLLAGGGKVDLSQIESRIRYLENIANEIGFEPKRNKQGKLFYKELKMPSITEIATKILDLETIFRLNSAVLHGHHFAVRNIGYDITEDEDGDLIFEKTFKKELVFPLIKIEANLFAKPILYKSVLFEWDSKEVKDSLELNRRIVNNSF